MTNVRKMALVDPRLLETLQNPMQPSVDTTIRDLDADMTSILDRTDIEVSDKVRLYNQALLRYNDMTKTRANKPTRVVVVREEKVVNGEDVEEENDCATEIIATMPKSLHMKARVLTARLKKDGGLERQRRATTRRRRDTRKQHNRPRSRFSTKT